MSQTETPLPRKRSRLFYAYTALWSVLGLGAFGYLLAVTVAPDLVTAHFPAFRSDTDHRSVVGEVASLRESVGEVQGDVARLKVDVASQADQTKALRGRVALLETVPEGETSSFVRSNKAEDTPAASEPVADTPETKTETKPEAKLDIEKISRDEPPPSETAEADTPTTPFSQIPVLLNQGTTSNTETPAKDIETGSVTPPAVPVAVKPTTVVAKPPAPKALPGIQLGTGQTIEDIQLIWLQLSDRHGAMLGNLQPRYLVGRIGNTPVYVLLAGPLKTAADAKKICESLSGDGVKCKSRDFQGNAL